MQLQKSTPKIIVFTTPSCPWCNRAKSYLKQHGFKFRDVDVSKDESAAKDLVRRTGQTGVPVILINNKPVVGFNKKEIDRLLNIRN